MKNHKFYVFNVSCFLFSINFLKLCGYIFISKLNTQGPEVLLWLAESTIIIDLLMFMVIDYLFCIRRGICDYKDKMWPDIFASGPNSRGAAGRNKTNCIYFGLFPILILLFSYKIESYKW